MIASLALLGGACFFVTASAQTSATRDGRIEHLVINQSGNETLTSPVLSIPVSNVLAADWPSFLDTHATGTSTLQVRSRENGMWGVWFPLAALDDVPSAELPKPGRTYSSPVFVAGTDAVQIRYRGAVSQETRNAFTQTELIYLDSRTQHKELHSIFDHLFGASATKADGLTIVPRSAWGANESYRFTASGKELWPPEHVAVQKFIIHHTAGSDGGSDPAATVRGIYYFHAVVLGWGDIGYNYLIDPAGTVYEGRYGGDSTVGGHTYNSALNINYNRGSTGIALLGNYDASVPTLTAQDALTTLLAQKAWLQRVAPTGISYFLHSDTDNIIGHGDVDQTECPGANLHALLAQLRLTTQQKYDALGPQPVPAFTATLGAQTVTQTVLEKGKTSQVNVDYTNTGNITWQSYVADRHIAIAPVGMSGDSLLKSADWASGVQVGSPFDANVGPGSLTHAVFTLTAPDNAVSVDQPFALIGPDGAEISGTRFTVHIDVANIDYAGRFDVLGIPATSFVRDTRTATVKVTNVGTQPWTAGSVQLQLYDVNDKPSAVRASSWSAPTGNFAMNEASVAPGATATFTVPVTAPQTVGSYLNILKIIRTDGKPFVADAPAVTLRADSHWKASFQSTTLPLAVLKTWRPSMTVKFLNTGAATWTKTMTLQVFDAGFKPSKFIGPTWATTTADIHLNEKSVPPGKVGTFTIRLKPPQKKGSYRQVFRLQIQGLKKEPLQGNTGEIVTRVD